MTQTPAPRVMFGFTPPKHYRHRGLSGLGDSSITGDFAAWLGANPVMATDVALYQAANPSDTGTPNLSASYTGQPLPSWLPWAGLLAIGLVIWSGNRAY